MNFKPYLSMKMFLSRTYTDKIYVIDNIFVEYFLRIKPALRTIDFFEVKRLLKLKNDKLVRKVTNDWMSKTT